MAPQRKALGVRYMFADCHLQCGVVQTNCSLYPDVICLNVLYTGFGLVMLPRL